MYYFVCSLLLLQQAIKFLQRIEFGNEFRQGYEEGNLGIELIVIIKRDPIRPFIRSGKRTSIYILKNS